ncbi:MttB4: trimethylamine corrinoid protein 2 [Desulfosarcina variabilis str. Montpellier]|uniref:trimethylamine methyltransferase family protein n=1 Tax=Desulfosarcina variabilis TaxID=2300 RepID=UPI003AFAFFD5
MRVTRHNYDIDATPRFTVLSEDQIEAIYYASLTVLYETGVRVYDQEGVDVAHAGGAIVEGTTDKSSLVKIPPSMVDVARATVPSKVVLIGPDRRYRMELYKNQIYYGGGSDTPFTLDPYTGERRRSTYQDVKNLARIGQVLPNYDFHMSLGITQDTAVGTYDRWQYLAMLEGTSKPINTTAVDVEGVRDQLEMAYIRIGGSEAWRKGPIFSLYIEPVSPLSHSREVVQKLLFCCDNDIPFVYTPCPLAGATAPATLAGVLVQALAESLFGIVLSQLRKPGASIIIGGLMSNMDMLSTIYCYGSPEMALLSAAYTDITKWLRVPEYETAGCSDAKLFDEQAAMEAAINIATSGLVGGNMIHDVGYLDSGLTSSPALMVAADEIIDMVKRIIQGIAVTPDSMALDVIDEVGPGGHFMEHDHTYERFKTQIWRPKFIHRQNWENWQIAGAKRYGQRIHEHVIEILEADTEPLLDKAMVKEMRRICELADARHKNEELDIKMFT